MTMDNHFLPQFYLSRWASDGQLWEYKKRKSGHLRGKPRSPKATGYERDLYKMHSKQGLDAHGFELKFLQKHDDIAARALAKLETTGNTTDEEICGWISFMLAMHLRHPDDIKAWREVFAKRWRNEFEKLQKKYETVRGDDSPQHICDYIEQYDPGRMEAHMFKLLSMLMQHKDLGQLLLEFEHVVVTPNSTVELITSDRPLLMTATLIEDDAYIIMPVGPKKLYVAGKTKQTLEKLLDKTGDQLVVRVNHMVCRHGNIAAYSKQPGMEDFIQHRLGEMVYDSWVTRMARSFESAGQ